MRFISFVRPVSFQRNMLIGAAAVFIAGGLLAHGLSLPKPVLHKLLFVLPPLLFLTALLYRHPPGLPLMVCCFFLTGLVHTGLGLLPPTQTDHLYHMLAQRSKVTLTGRVLNMPEFDGRSTRFDLAADTIMFAEDPGKPPRFQPTRGKIRLTIESEPPKQIIPGRHILVRTTAGRISNSRTPGAFDYRMHMAERDIFVSGRISSPVEIVLFSDMDDPFLQSIRLLPERLRQQTGFFLDSNLVPETAGLYKALLIGSRTGIPESIQEQFKATGCMHLLAISGLHMGLLGLLTVAVLTWLMKRSTNLLLHTHVPSLAVIFSLVPLFCYAFIAGMNTPVLRALLMSGFFLIGIVQQWQRSILHVLAAAALFILICTPLALFTVSFQFSFAAVLAIALVYPRLLNISETRPTATQPKIRSAILAPLLVSMAATIGCLPLLLFHFNRFSPLGPLLNLLVEPFLCFWALPLGLLAMPLIWLAPAAAKLLLAIGSLGITAAEKITAFGAALPFASVWTITPTAGQIIIYFCLLGVLLLQSSSLKIKGFAVAALTLLGSWFTMGLWLHLPPKETKVAFLDVGQGSSTLVRLAEGKSILIDGGTRTGTGYDVGKHIIAPFLWKEKFWNLDDIVISHPDSDHYNGLAFIIRRFHPKRLWVNGDGKEISSYTRLLELATAQGTQIMYPQPGRDIPSPGPARISFLTGAIGRNKPHVANDENSTPFSVNDRSLVVRLTQDDVSFLFPGDLGIQGEKRLLESGAELKADVLLAGHHGSRGSSSRPFVSAVNPKLIVVSSGGGTRSPYLGNPGIQAWESDGGKVLPTMRLGTIGCMTDGRKVECKPLTR